MIGVDLDSIQTVVIRLFLVVTMLSMGLHVTIPHIVAHVREPRLLAGAIAINLVALPAIVWAMCRLLQLPEGIAVGLIVTAVAAGGSLGPKLVELSSGDVAFAIGLMFILDLCAATLIAPISAVLLGGGAGAIGIDLWPVFASVAIFQAFPLVGGLALARARPGTSRRIQRPSILLSTALLVVVTLVVLVNGVDEVLAVGPLAFAVMIVSVGAALALGGALGGSRRGVRRSLALSTAQRSAPLALFVVTEIGIPGAVGTVVAFALCQLLINGAVAISLGRRTLGEVAPATA